MNLKSNKKEYITKKAFDGLVGLYQKNLITHGTFITCIIDSQKRLVIDKLVGEKDGIVAGEVLLKRMKSAGIDIVI